MLALALRWGTAGIAGVERVGGTTSIGDTATTPYLSLAHSVSSLCQVVLKPGMALKQLGNSWDCRYWRWH